MENQGVYLSVNDQQKFEIVSQVDSGMMRRAKACRLLDVSERTLSRYLKKYRERGLMFLKHGNCGKKPANRHSSELKHKCHTIMKEELWDFNMTHAREIIEERLQVKISRETFRRWCHDFKLVKHKVKRRSKARYKRYRQIKPGLMIQFDGSYHKWYGGKERCLIAGIDDATSSIVAAEFCDSENVFDCMKVLREIIEKHGVFESLYVDRAGVYGGIKRRGFSNVTRALKALGVDVIYARSPQGKGRVERLFNTVQDRLIPELRLNGIKKDELANRYLKEIYVPNHNKKFAVSPSFDESGFKELDPNIDLRALFCVQQQRTVGKDHSISLDSKTYVLKPEDGKSLSRLKVEVRIYPDCFEVYFAGQQIPYYEFKLGARSSDMDKVAG